MSYAISLVFWASTLTGCGVASAGVSVVGATAGAVISVGGSAASAAIDVTGAAVEASGKAVGKALDAPATDAASRGGRP